MTLHRRYIQGDQLNLSPRIPNGMMLGSGQHYIFHHFQSHDVNVCKFAVQLIKFVNKQCSHSKQPIRIA